MWTTCEWAPRAKQIWESTPHTKPMTQYYRDTPEGQAEIARLAARQREEAEAAAEEK